MIRDNHVEECTKVWSNADSIDDVCKLMILWLQGKIPSMHSRDNIKQNDDYIQKLIKINSNGILTTRSQCNTHVDGLNQKNYIEFNIDQTRIKHMLELLKKSNITMIITVNAEYVYSSGCLHPYEEYIIVVKEDFYNHYVMYFPDFAALDDHYKFNLRNGIVILDDCIDWNNVKFINLNDKNTRKPLKFIQCDQYHIFSEKLKNTIKSMALVTVIDADWNNINSTYAIDIIADIAIHLK